MAMKGSKRFLFECLQIQKDRIPSLFLFYLTSIAPLLFYLQILILGVGMG